MPAHFLRVGCSIHRVWQSLASCHWQYGHCSCRTLQDPLRMPAWNGARKEGCSMCIPLPPFPVQVITPVWTGPATSSTRHIMLRQLVQMRCLWSTTTLETSQQQWHPRMRTPPGEQLKPSSSWVILGLWRACKGPGMQRQRVARKAVSCFAAPSLLYQCSAACALSAFQGACPDHHSCRPAEPG